MVQLSPVGPLETFFCYTAKATTLWHRINPEPETITTQCHSLYALTPKS